ncbi:unnamed protein product [Polarella glacialis]|uniref:Uncharacterized protein n=1 Tax=Polarella glacialis TaxID=89957 RepID=A0A813LDU2_POLGL|nr:unnamed protein product [Polarella glacialis]
MGRVQRVAKELQRMEEADAKGKKAKKGEGEAEEAPWASQALASPLIARFRHHFCRPEGDLCRMDKPEWAFRYLIELASDHTAELDRWAKESSESGARSAEDATLQARELSEGLAVALAAEACLFVRTRLPLLASDLEARPTLLHMMHHFVSFHGDIVSAGGPAAGAAAFADFEANRSFEVDVQGAEAQASASQRASGSRGGLVGVRLIKGLSQLAARTEEPASPSHSPEAVAVSLGFLDAWASADADFVTAKLSAALGPAGNSWRPRPLRHIGARPGGGSGGPEAAELANLLADLFLRAGERGSCLAGETSCKAYCSCVLEPGLRQVLSAIKAKWNALGDALEEAKESALLVETLQEICIFLDGFPLATHMSAAVDEAGEMRLAVLEKLAGSLEELTKASLRSLRSESSVFSFRMGKQLQLLARWLRPENFRAVGRSGAAKLGSFLFGQLRRQAPFANEVEAELFAANCRDDLGGLLATLLDPSDLSPLQPVWESCVLLMLPGDVAAQTLTALQHVARISPSLTIRDATEPPSNDVLERKQAEALAFAGVSVLPAADVMTVLKKRADMVAAGFEEQDTPFSVKVIKTAIVSTRFCPTLAGGAGRLVAGRLRSTFDAAAGFAASAAADVDAAVSASA